MDEHNSVHFRKSCISTNMNELTTESWYVSCLMVIRTHEHEGHAGDSRRHNVVGGGGAPTLGDRRRRRDKNSGGGAASVAQTSSRESRDEQVWSSNWKGIYD